MQFAVRVRRYHSPSLAIYPGWTMVFVCTVCVALVFSSSTTVMPLIYGPVIDEFGWSRTQATLIFTYKNIASALAALLIVGPICERIGLRRVFIGACILTAASMTSFLWIGTLWAYYVAGISLGIGVATTFIAAKILVSRWFARNQGLALGTMLAGSSAGGVLFPLAFAYLNGVFGWRVAFASLSLGVWCIALPLYLAKAKEDPSEADLEPELGKQATDDQLASSESRGGTFAGLLAGRMFWLIAASMLLAAAADAGLMQHTILYLEREAGLAMTVAAAALSGTLALGIIAKAGAGWVFDRLSVTGISIWYLLLAISVAALFSVTGTLTLILFASIRGIAHGGLMSEPALLARHCYGPRLLNLTVPTFVGIWSLGAAVGPLLLSVIYDAQGSYRNGLLLLIGFSILAAAFLRGVWPAYASSVKRAQHLYRDQPE
jgi:OFA family oxalate/formate antiporter-like MFS transporter